MELTQLHYFVTVAQTQHLTRAAESLRISQPALSKAISRLESELGMTLFDRSSNRITLNRNGQIYLRYVQEALESLNAGKYALEAQASAQSGNVSIMTSCSGILQPAIRRFLTAHRDIHYQQIRYTSSHIAEHLENGNADFSVTTTPLCSAKFSWTPLVQDELYVVAPPEHPFQQRESISIHDLDHVPLIISNNLLSIHDIVTGGFARHGLAPHIAYELNNPPLTEQLIDEGRGITFSPGLKTDPMPQRRALPWRLIPVKEHPFHYELGILRLRNRFRSPASELLEQFLLDWFSDSENWSRTVETTESL